MKTGKKILALLLVFCFMMAAVPAYAASFAHYLTYRVDNELWGCWDADASIQNVKVKVEINLTSITLTFEDAVMAKLLNSGEFVNGYNVTLPDATFGEGDKTVTVPGGKFAIKSSSGLWVTHYLPTNGAVANAMVEESKTDEALRALLNIDPVTNAANLSTANNVYNNNINAYIKYKTGLTSLSISTDVAILHAPQFRANGDFALTSFFLNDDQINTFVGGETPVVGDYVLNQGNAVGLYKSGHKNNDSNLDGPYTVFTAPATGVYDVFVLKRDSSASSVVGNANQRHIQMNIAGVTMNFGYSNVSGTMGYQWQHEDTHTPVYLTKGQKVPVRILSGTGYFAGAYGFAFVPRSDAGTPVSVTYNASPTNVDDLDKITIAANVPAAQTSSVSFEGETLSVTAGAAESYYPNVRKADANGNYINQPTLLDALVAADKQADIGIDPHVLVTDSTFPTTMAGSNGFLYTRDTDVMALSPTTADIFGLNLPRGGYDGVFSGSEAFLLSSGTSVNITVKVPEDGTYYMIANGGSWETKRKIVVQLLGDSKNTYINDNGENSFCFGGEGLAKNYSIQSSNGLNLTSGYYTMNVAVTGGAVRLSYVGLVKADSKEEAAAIQANFTPNTKAKFDAYFNKTERIVFDGSTIPNLSVAVNGAVVKEGDWDRYFIKDGDVIETGVFDPIELKGYETFDSNLTHDNNRQLTAETFANSNYIIIVYANEIAGLNLPVNPNIKDSMRGMYLNGYITYKEDDEATTGDDTKVANYIHYPIQGNSIDSSGRLIIALNVKEVNNNTILEGLSYRNINGSFNKNAVGIFDCSNLFISDKRFDGADDSVKAVCKDGKVVISTMKAQPISVFIKNADGTTASVTNYALSINASAEVAVEAGQTVYVWGGTPYLASGTTLRPLCAPITVE